MKTHPLRPLFTLALTGCLAASLSTAPTASAQTATPTPTVTATPTPTDRTANGQFHDSNGNQGTYVETFTVADDVATDTIVYTLSGSTGTRTETLTTTTNTDGTKTVVFSDLGFGATVAFTSTTTYTVGKGGSAVGSGTFTAADGTTGVLAAVVAHNGQTSITSTDFTSTAGVLTREVRLEEKANGSDTEKVLEVDGSGTLTTVTTTRFGGMHHQHP